jgi:hypothetical protein
MKGLQMMLKSLGINIDPAEVEALWKKLSVAIPQFLTEADAKITSIDSRLSVIESRLTEMERFSRPELVGPVTVQETKEPVYCETSNCPGATQ